MITRDLSNVQVVHAFNNKSTALALAPFNLFTVAGQVCTCGGVLSTSLSGQAGFGGPMIDRLGLADNYNAVVPAISAWGAITASATTCSLAYMSVQVGIQHSSSTCSADFSDYSTEHWLAARPLQRTTTATTTADTFYDATGESTLVSPANAALMTTSATTSTSTGYAYYVSGPSPVFPLTGAKRFLRMVVVPRIENDGCAGSYMHVTGSFVFGDPDKGKASSTPRARVHIASSAGACTS